MRKDLEKVYNPQDVEDKLYKFWCDNGYFNAEIDANKKPFTIVIPPPNITGQLHMGHALNVTYQDILIRYKRMQGYSALWVPGTDHASIATEVKVVERMMAEGISKEEAGREGFLSRAWEWRTEFGGRIVEQLKKMGTSCDWRRERFTMDEGLSDAVLEFFVKLYNNGKIYRGAKLINWCPCCQTTISDAEVEHEDMEGKLWHLKYPIDGTDEFLQFATTRPETMLGDTALAVNPHDERYTELIGKTVTIPVINRTIPIIADYYVDKDYGTGVVKITPAHDPNDFEVGLRHNLPQINIMNDDGTMNENAGKYKDLDRYDARKKLLEEFEQMGLFVKTEAITHAVGTHDRCGKIIEPLIKTQWFVKMHDLAQPAIKAYKENELNITPERFGKIYLNWLENIRDWCISRQLWWGHRIPAYYCQKCGHMEVSKAAVIKCAKCSSDEIKQDEDVLDTWFSSALWPFSTLGWPNKTPEFDYFYPTSVLVTMYDIIFFWVIRMVFSGIENTGVLPFKDVLFHGMVRDANGKKMSKSMGNGIDPLEVVSKYGADALRLSLMMGSSTSSDMRFYWEKIEPNRNFLNKLWNATRFILMNLDDTDYKQSEVKLTDTDKWILSKANMLNKEMTELMDSYEMGMAVQKVYDFLWDEFCDWYIEMVKPRLYNMEDETRTAALFTLQKVLINALKLLHPYIPFITEEIFSSLQSDEDTIMLSNWPEYDEKYNFAKEEASIELAKEAVKGIRAIRTEMNVPPSRKAKLIVVSQDRIKREIFADCLPYLKTLGYASEVEIVDQINDIEDAVSVVISDAVIYIPFAELVDAEKELERLSKEKEKLQKEIDRVNIKLGNEGFVSKAPEKVITEEKEKLEKYINILAEVEIQISRVKK